LNIFFGSTKKKFNFFLKEVKLVYRNWHRKKSNLKTQHHQTNPSYIYCNVKMFYAPEFIDVDKTASHIYVCF